MAGRFLRAMAREARERWRAPRRRHTPPPLPQPVAPPLPATTDAGGTVRTTIGTATHPMWTGVTVTTAPNWGTITRAEVGWDVGPPQIDPWADLYLDEGVPEIEIPEGGLWNLPQAQRLYCQFGEEPIGAIYIEPLRFKGIALQYDYYAGTAAGRFYTNAAYRRGQQWAGWMTE